MKLNHTPGPWEVYKYIPGNLPKYTHFLAVSQLKSIFEYDINIICKIEKRNESNAQLIAAAPEMLEILIEIYKNTSIYTNNSENCILCKIQPIIEKATGKSIKEIL